MTKTTTGWAMLIGAMGMMFGLLSVDLMSLHSWTDATTPLFVGTTIGHIGAVLAAFVGGKIIPEQRDDQHTRVTDAKVTI